MPFPFQHEVWLITREWSRWLQPVVIVPYLIFMVCLQGVSVLSMVRQKKMFNEAADKSLSCSSSGQESQDPCNKVFMRQDVEIRTWKMIPAGACIYSHSTSCSSGLLYKVPDIRITMLNQWSRKVTLALLQCSTFPSNTCVFLVDMEMKYSFLQCPFFCVFFFCVFWVWKVNFCFN